MKKLLIGLLCLSCMFVAGCVQSAPASVEIEINGLPVTLDLLADNLSINPPMLTSERDNTIDFSDVQGASVWVDGELINATKPHVFSVSSISAQNTMDIKVQIKGISRNFTLNTVPDDFESFLAVNNGAKPGVYYMGIQNYAVKLSSDSSILFYKSCDGKVWDFNKIEKDGKVRYTILHTTSTQRPLGSVSYSVSNAQVLNEAYETIDVVEGLAPFEETKTPLESHDFLYIDDGHYLLSAYVGKRTSAVNPPYGARVVACVLQEVKNGKVLWQFDTTEHSELYYRSVEGGDYENKLMPWADYAHFNAFTIDPKDGNVIISLRNANCLLKLERGTGKILWQMGGRGDQFALTAKQQFFRAHAVQVLDNGAILLFDNGNTSNVLPYPKNAGGEPLPQTRVLEFVIDEKIKRITAFSDHSLLGYFTYAAGNAQKQSPAHYVISWGGRSAGMPMISEVDFLNKKILFEVMSSLDNMVYRAYKYEF